jgi:hypothetical protein
MWTRNDEDAARDEDHRKGKHDPWQGWCGLCVAERRAIHEAYAAPGLALRDEERQRFAAMAVAAARRARLVEYDRAETLEALRVECSRNDGEGTYGGLWDKARAVLAAHGLEVENL